MGKQGFVVYNYIDDMYACIHKYRANDVSELLKTIIQNPGLPLNEKKVFPPAKVMSVMGITIDTNHCFFLSIHSLSG